jgi:flavin-binding protein dodecin
MSVAKIIEVNAASTQSFEDAVKVGIAQAAKTLTGIQGAWVKEQKVVVKDGKVQEFRVDMKVTFLLED